MKINFKLICSVVTVAFGGLAVGAYRNDRPVRGVWLRPPAALASLEPSLQTYARAGITDLYMETFYWGVSSGRQGVFNSRYGYDLLQGAIAMAARYNIRIHAWVEAGYWQYGTTGGYNFTNNPEWRVISRSTGLPGGDQASQVFANLCHPGVQAKLRAYTKELAAYPGLWGIQTDYHRFPIDDVTTDSYTAPWTYEDWTQSAFRTYIGVPTANITSQASTSSGTYWNQFLTFRRNGVSEAAHQMYLGIQEASNDVVFSAAVFPATVNNSAQLSKCQDWAPWCTSNYLDHAVPMAYSNVVSELNVAKSMAGSKKVVAGLAITSGHPAVTTQLASAKSVGIEDWVLFEGNQITSGVDTTIRTWIDNPTNAAVMRADLNSNGVMDMGDYSLILAAYSGNPVPASSGDRMNLDANSTLDSADHKLIREAITKYRIGAFGKLSEGDRSQLNLARTAPPATGVSVKNLYDFDVDGDVDDADAKSMERMGRTEPFVFVQVNLGNWVGSLAGQLITFQWLDSAGIPLSSWSDELASNGRVTVPAPGTGTYKLRLKSGAWLKKTVDLTIGTTDVGSVSFVLVNGDVDGSGEVDAADIDAVISAFGALTGIEDIDGSGEVDAVDIDIVIGNFGAIDQ